jgi:hypothetical protein
MRKWLLRLFTFLAAIWWILGFLGNLQTAQAICQSGGPFVRVVLAALTTSQWLALVLFLVGVVTLFLGRSGVMSTSPPTRKNSGLMLPEGDSQWRDPQPIFIALAELKKLLNEGRTMLAKYQVDAAPNPTFLEVEDYRKRTLDDATQQVFGLTPKELATFEQPWDEEELLLAQAEMVDHGFIKNGSPDMAIYRHLWSRVKRLKGLISLIESK